MLPPDRIRVKLASEEAGAISITPVVVREMSLGELLDEIVAQVGKSPARVHRLLRAGVLVRGASRFRWAGLAVELHEVSELLSGYPDPDPERAFVAAASNRVVFHTAARWKIELDRESAARRRWLRRDSFWNAFLLCVASGSARYVTYSYRDRADCYHMELSAAAAEGIRNAARLLRYTRPESRLRASVLTAVEFYLPRSG